MVVNPISNSIKSRFDNLWTGPKEVRVCLKETEQTLECGYLVALVLGFEHENELTPVTLDGCPVFPISVLKGDNTVEDRLQRRAIVTHAVVVRNNLPIPSAEPEIELGRGLKQHIEAEQAVRHPLHPEIEGIYGVIFTEGDRNVTVFADGEVDRSPCGSGTSARLALLDATGELPRGQTLTHRSIVGSTFLGRVVEEVEGGVITEVEGSAHLTGRHEFVLEPDDELGTGFLLR